MLVNNFFFSPLSLSPLFVSLFSPRQYLSPAFPSRPPSSHAPPSPTMSSHWSPSHLHPVPLLSSPYSSSYPLYPSLPLPSTSLPLPNPAPSLPPFPSLARLPPLYRYASIPSWQLHLLLAPPNPPPISPPSPWLVSTAVVSEGQMTGELAPGRALSHPGAIRLVANNRCFRPGEDQSGGIMGNVRSSAFYTSAQMDEITLVSF